MQSISHDLRVVNIGRLHCDGMNLFALTINTDMRLHAKVPWVAFPGRAHLRAQAADSGALWKPARG